MDLIADFKVEEESLSGILKKYHFPAKVQVRDLADYGDKLQKHKKSKSFSQKTISTPDDLIKIVFWNVSTSMRKNYHLSCLPKEKMVLFMWEPPVVISKMYSDEITSCFSKVYTWRDDLVDNKTYFKFYYPVLRPMIQPIPSYEEKKLCTLVARNIISDFPNELYSERRKAIEFFESKNEVGFEFYGKNWDPSPYKSYRGVIPDPDKIDVIKNYRFSICYENTKEIEGYVTEKIFDCFTAGNVPVYWGASNIEKYVPKDCFIDRRDFKNLDELYAFLKNMSKDEYQGYINRIRNYLESDQAKLFSHETFERIFYSAVSQ